MRCDKCKGQLADYINGALSAETQQALEAHLGDCPDCRHELEDIRELDARLRQDIPPIWERIEPSPQFMAQLKHLQLEPSPRLVPGIIEWLSSLWGNHRMAMATGLSVCLVVALMFTGVFNFDSGDDDDETAVSKNDQQAERYETMSESAPAATQANEADQLTGSGFDELDDRGNTLPATEEAAGEIEKAMPDDVASPLPTRPPSTTYGPSFSVAVPAAIDGWDCTTQSLYTPNQKASTILGYTSEEVERAVQVALSNSELQELIQAQGFERIDVSNTPPNADFPCDGLTIILIREDFCIWACIDANTGEMTSYTTHYSSQP